MRDIQREGTPTNALRPGEQSEKAAAGDRHGSGFRDGRRVSHHRYMGGAAEKEPAAEKFIFSRPCPSKGSPGHPNFP